MFVQGTPTNACVSYDVCGGEIITNKGKLLFDSSPDFNCSVGVGAIYNGKDAIISCGHGMDVGDRIYYDNKHIGTVKVVCYENNIYGDYSIIQLTNGYTTEGGVLIGIGKYSSSYSHVQNIDYFPLTGQVLFKCTRNGGYGACTMLARHESVQVTDPLTNQTVTILGQMRVKFNDGAIVPGDSGGGLFTYDEENKIAFVGIACSTSNSDPYISHITPGSSIPYNIKKLVDFA